MGNLGHFSVVTDDVLLHAFSFLPGRCLAKCGATSRAFLGLADRDALWRDLCTCSLDALLSEGTVAPVGRYTWLPQIAASRRAGRGGCAAAGPGDSVPGGSVGDAAGGAAAFDGAGAVRACALGKLGLAALPHAHRLLFQAMGHLGLVGCWAREMHPQAAAASSLAGHPLPAGGRAHGAAAASMAGLGPLGPGPSSLYRGELLGVGLGEGCLVGEKVQPDATREAAFRCFFTADPRFPRRLLVETVAPPDPYLMHLQAPPSLTRRSPPPLPSAASHAFPAPVVSTAGSSGLALNPDFHPPHPLAPAASGPGGQTPWVGGAPPGASAPTRVKSGDGPPRAAKLLTLGGVFYGGGRAGSFVPARAPAVFRRLAPHLSPPPGFLDTSGEERGAGPGQQVPSGPQALMVMDDGRPFAPRLPAGGRPFPSSHGGLSSESNSSSNTSSSRSNSPPYPPLAMTSAACSRRVLASLGSAAALAGGPGGGATFDLLARLSGLWVAPYGSHGLEIVHVSPALTKALGPKAAHDADPHSMQVEPGAANVGRAAAGTGSAYRTSAAAASPELVGLKVVGDANVPAGKLSFTVDASLPMDPHERLNLDQRLVVAFPPEGATITDLSSRRGNIAAWYRGKGQINRIQGVWEPDWVGIDFLVYESGPVGFSVLWDEQGEVIRHIIDFVPLFLG